MSLWQDVKNRRLRSLLEQIDRAAPLFPDPDSTVDDAACEVELTWAQVRAARTALTDLKMLEMRAHERG